MNSGIYYIGSIVDGKIYIGSAVNFRKRFQLHRSLFKRNKHHNKHLQSAWNKHGSANFIFEIIENTSKEELLKKEQFWIDILKPEYNFCKKAFSLLGCHWTLSDTTKDKMRKIRKGETNPNSKLTKETVKEIRRLFNDGYSIYKLAKQFDICFQNVSLIINNKRWYDSDYKKLRN
jgi:group I intron endonuclease